MHARVATVVLVLGLALATTVTVKNCEDGACTVGCQSQQFQSGQCLQEEGTSNTVELTCYSGPTMCNNLAFYSDPQCTDLLSQVNNVCNSCQDNFTVSCGALHDAVFVAVNCTDTACQDCGGAIIVPFSQCKLVAPYGYAYITAVSSCEAISFTTYEGASCEGNNFTQQFGSGRCFNGTMFTCG